MSIFFESGRLNISNRYKRSYRQTGRLNTKWASQIFFPFISHVNNVLLILHFWPTVFKNSWSTSLASKSIICLLLWPIILVHLTICNLVLLLRPKSTRSGIKHVAPWPYTCSALWLSLTWNTSPVLCQCNSHFPYNINSCFGWTSIPSLTSLYSYCTSKV